jgi:hypothetical protein
MVKIFTISGRIKDKKTKTKESNSKSTFKNVELTKQQVGLLSCKRVAE